ncbi:MAG: hypothetical protein ACW99A_19460, partial [Candidatus Kariarchaeaceae archaeon]
MKKIVFLFLTLFILVTGVFSQSDNDNIIVFSDTLYIYHVGDTTGFTIIMPGKTIVIPDTIKANGVTLEFVADVNFTGAVSGIAGSGTVTSVDFAAPSEFSVSGNPITGAGTITLGYAAGQTANRVLATPSGASGPLALRLISNNHIDAGAAIAYSKLNLTGAILLADLAITGTPDGTKYLRDDYSWQTVAGGGSGDMTKAVYDKDDNAIVDESDSLTVASSSRAGDDLFNSQLDAKKASDSDSLGGEPPSFYQTDSEAATHAGLPNVHHNAVTKSGAAQYVILTTQDLAFSVVDTLATHINRANFIEMIGIHGGGGTDSTWTSDGDSLKIRIYQALKALELEIDDATVFAVDTLGNLLIRGVSYAWPSSDGTVGQVLHTDGAGNLSWDTDDGAGGGAPTDAQYVTLALNGSLTQERVLVEGNSITITDGGANGNVTVLLNPTDFNLYDSDSDTIHADPTGFSPTNTNAVGTRAWQLKDAGVELAYVDTTGAAGFSGGLTAIKATIDTLDIPEIGATPVYLPANTSRIYSIDDNGFTRLELVGPDGVVSRFNRDVIRI